VKQEFSLQALSTAFFMCCGALSKAYDEWLVPKVLSRKVVLESFRTIAFLRQYTFN
jgi:hypothetical protein